MRKSPKFTKREIYIEDKIARLVRECEANETREFQFGMIFGLLVAAIFYLVTRYV
jgi:hypothetical protein